MTVKTRFPWMVCCALFVVAQGRILCAQQSTGTVPALSAPYQSATLTQISSADATFPTFSHGYFIRFVRHNKTAGTPNIYLFGASGELEDQVSVRPPGTAQLFLASVDVGATGRLGFAGTASKADGSMLFFIATSNLDGGGAQYFNTGGYRVTQLALADDGSVWAVGAEQGVALKSGSAITWKWQNYDILRHYNAAGVLLEHFLPRWEPNVASVTITPDKFGHGPTLAYDVYGNPTTTNQFDGEIWGYANAWKVSRQAFLKSAGNYTVLYNGSNRTFYRYTLAKGLISQGVAFDYGTQERITGFALSPDGHIYASIKNSSPQHPFSLGPFTLSSSLSGGSARWSRISREQSTTSANLRGFAVLGSDGSALVYRDKAGSMHWSTAESRAKTNGR